MKSASQSLPQSVCVTDSGDSLDNRPTKTPKSQNNTILTDQCSGRPATSVFCKVK